MASSWSWVTSTRRDGDLRRELAEPGPELLADLGVEGAERLVEQEHRGSMARARARAMRWR